MSGAEGVPGWRRPPVGDRARRWEPGTVGRFGGEMGVHRRGPAALRDVVAVVVVVCPCRVRGGTGVFEEFDQGRQVLQVFRIVPGGVVARLQVQFRIFIHDNSKKAPVKVRLDIFAKTLSVAWWRSEARKSAF